MYDFTLPHLRKYVYRVQTIFNMSLLEVTKQL